MKNNIQKNNTKITDYFKLKCIPHTPLAREIPKPVLSQKSYYQKQKQNKQKQYKTTTKIVQLQLQSDQTQLLQNQNDINKQQKCGYVCKQMIMIGPCDVTYFYTVNRKLRQICNEYSKSNAVKFILENAQFYNVKNIKILDDLNDQNFWNKTLLKMFIYAADKEKQQAISSCIPMLCSQKPNFVELTKAQVLMILINMFFCILPWQTYRPYLSFSTLMAVRQKDRQSVIKTKKEKLKCFINYFNIMLAKDYNKLKNQILSIQRICKKYDKKQLIERSQDFTKVTIKRGVIQDEYRKSVIVDFANKNIGGGVLANGAVQEQILFCIFPQLLATICICEEIRDNQSIIIANATRMSEYSGYSDTFNYKGPFQIFQNEQKNFESLIIAIDAIDFSQKICKGQSQYTIAAIHRQLIKAATGFEGVQLLAGSQMPICTGRWGCGAFKGDIYLKFIIQWIACSYARRQMVYMAQDQEQLKQLNVMTKFLKKYDTRDVLQIISQYNGILKKSKNISFLQYLKRQIS